MKPTGYMWFRDNGQYRLTTKQKAPPCFNKEKPEPVYREQDINNLLETLEELAEVAYFSGDREIAQRAIDVWEGKV